MTLLYDRLGGSEAISLVVDKFYDFVLKDNRLAHYFNNTDMTKQRQRQKQFITLVCGGPNDYQGKDMKTAHKGMGLGHLEYDATWQNLLKSLTHFNVPQKQINELKDIFYSVEEEIIEKKTNNHETPNNYKNKQDPNLKQQQKCLYEKLGGQAAIKLVVNKFYDFMLKDNRVNFYFSNTNMDKQRSSQVQFISMVTGGPVVYKGKDMKTAHCPYKISQIEFDATWENLNKALNAYNVPINLINQLKEVFYSVQGDIVNASSHQQSKQKQNQKCPFTHQSMKEQLNHQQSLYERLGGNGALNLVVNKFYDLLLENPKVNFYFTNTDMKKQRNSQLQFLSMVTGGPMIYKGKDMKAAHCPYKITQNEFDVTWQTLQTAMKFYKVGDGLIRQVKEIFYSVEGDIVREHALGRRNQRVQHKISSQFKENKNNGDQINVSYIHPVTNVLQNSHQSPNEQLKNIYCPFSQQSKVTQQQKRQLKQQFIEKQQQAKQPRKLNNNPYQKTFY